MAKARGISKVVAYKKETTFGELAGDVGAKQLRRTSADFNLTKENYESSEIRSDQQVADFRLGTQSVDGSLAGELSAGTYSDFIQSVLARDFTAAGTEVLVDFTIAASGLLHTLTRATGSWLTNFKVGDVVQLSVAGSAANQGNNLVVVGVTALVLTVRALSSTTLVPEAITGATVSAIGKNTFIPKTGHTSDSYTIESFYSDIAQSEVYTGARVGTFNVSVPASGLVTCDASFMGQGLKQTGTTQYFTNPAALSTTGVVAAVNGTIILDGSATNACITDASISIDRGLEASQCIGNDKAEEIFLGTIRVTGSLSIYFEDAWMRDKFKDEQTISIVLALASGSAKDADVIVFTLPKVKISNFSTQDAEMAVMATADFTAMLNDNETSGLIGSTIAVTDTSLV